MGVWSSQSKKNKKIKQEKKENHTITKPDCLRMKDSASRYDLVALIRLLTYIYGEDPGNFACAIDMVLYSEQRRLSISLVIP